jgi:hypothetical protein
MAKIANALTISEIEQILYARNSRYETGSWTAAGVECRRDRHRYSGQAYEFTIDILQARSVEPGRPSWQVLIGTERWSAGVSTALIRDAKWLKLVTGNSSDVRDWVRRSRPLDAA